MANEAMNDLAIALLDAARNCEREGAETTLVLRSGREIKGHLERWQSGARTAHVKTRSGDWATVLIAEIAAVVSERP